MTERIKENADDGIYTQEEYEKDLIHADVLMGYQKMLTERLGRSVTLDEAEDVAYGWS